MERTLEQRVTELEIIVKALLDNTTKNPIVEAAKAGTFGSNRKWTPEQHESLTADYAESQDILELTLKHNTKWGPEGFTERSPTAIACQLYKIIPSHELTEKIRKMAEKYMK